ncbi:MAG TPA: tetratricopeptide repeat protein [Steroidobacter sp.]|nr:tetratricopeptide repeat protein [Steroidobacter sp.]
MTSRRIVAIALLSAGLAMGSGALARANKPVPPAKAVKQAETNLKRLIKEGEDRPSVYEARLQLVAALRQLDSCDVNDRVDAELAKVTSWVERIGVPVRVDPQVVYNELGRAGQKRAGCSDDEAQKRTHHEAALRAFERAREAAKQNNDALNQAIVLYNAAASAEALGDLPQAIALLEQACAVDREYALNENYMEDYRELVRLKDEKNGVETPPEAIEQHLASLHEVKVALAFKPVHGEKRRYRGEMRKVTLADGQRQEQIMDVQYSEIMTVKDDLVTVAIDPSDSKVSGRDAQSAAKNGAVDAQTLMAQLLAQPLSYTVKTSGEFVGATGLDEVRRIVLAKMDETFAASEDAERRAGARRIVEQVLSDAVVNQQIADDWAMTVGFWVGAELDMGDWYTLDVQAPQPLLPSSTLKYTYSFKVNRRVACDARDAKKSCVELIIEGSPDREQFADYMVATMKQLIGKLPRKQVRWFRARLAEDAEMVQRHVLVVDPATLRTHRQLKTKRTYVAAFQSGGQPRIEQETDISELQPPAAPNTAQTPARPNRGSGARAKK